MAVTIPDFLYGVWNAVPNAENQNLKASLTIDRDAQGSQVTNSLSIWFHATDWRGISDAWYGRGQFDGSTVKVHLDKDRGLGALQGDLTLRLSGNTLIGAIPMYSNNPWTFVNGAPLPPQPAHAAETQLDMETALIRLVAAPQVHPPVFKGTVLQFTTSKISLHGEVNLIGTAATSANGWELGFIQVQLQDINFFEYRGLSREDGCMLLDRTVHRGEPDFYCRDTNVYHATEVWKNSYWNGHGAGTLVRPQTLTCRFEDEIADIAFLYQQNTNLTLAFGKTTAPNYLKRARKLQECATVLSAKDPKGNYHHLCYIVWSAQWTYTFQPNVDITGKAWGVSGEQRAYYSTVQPYDPTSHILTARLLSGPITECCHQRFSRIDQAAGTGGSRVRRHQFPDANMNLDSFWRV